MKEYRIQYTAEAKEDINKFIKAGEKQILKKIQILIAELKIHPKTGEGNPKRARQFPGNVWSRRITKKHRLIYEIFENIVTVQVFKAGGHYFDN